MSLNDQIRAYMAELGRKSAKNLGKQGRKERARKAGLASGISRRANGKCANSAQP